MTLYCLVKELDGSGRGLIEVLSLNLPERTEQNNEKFDSGYPACTLWFKGNTSRDKSRALSLKQFD